MGVRNCKDLGENLQLIVKRLLANDNLVNLLYYSDEDPLSQPHLSEEQKKTQIFEKLIKIVPRLDPQETAQSCIAITITDGMKDSGNSEFRNVEFAIEVFVPLTSWIIKDINLRPFAIMGEIEKSIEHKTVNGLGQIAGGNFQLNFLTEEIGSYRMIFEVISYD